MDSEIEWRFFFITFAFFLCLWVYIQHSLLLFFRFPAKKSWVRFLISLPVPIFSIPQTPCCLSHTVSPSLAFSRRSECVSFNWTPWRVHSKQIQPIVRKCKETVALVRHPQFVDSKMRRETETPPIQSHSANTKNIRKSSTIEFHRKTKNNSP